jgi:hypothetical protein
MGDAWATKMLPEKNENMRWLYAMDKGQGMIEERGDRQGLYVGIYLHYEIAT